MTLSQYTRKCSLPFHFRLSIDFRIVGNEGLGSLNKRECTLWVKL